MAFGRVAFRGADLQDSRVRYFDARVSRVSCQVSSLSAREARHGDSAMCCGFGVGARAGAKKLVRRGGREFFVSRNRCTAHLPPQSPVTSHCHRAGRGAACGGWMAGLRLMRSARLGAKFLILPS